MGIYIDIHTHNPSGKHPSPQGVGIHPWHATEGCLDEEALRSATLIGEIGLDYACEVCHKAQEQLFCQQLALAERLCKPVVIHSVRAFEPVMRCLARYTLKAVIFHGFIGSRQQAERAIARGYYLSFGEGAFRSPRTLEAMRSIPLAHLFAETDQSEVSIEKIYQNIAREREITIEQLQTEITKNYNRIFLQHNE